MTAPDDLRRPVGGDLAPREALGGRERERHGRVDVTARDLADRVHECRDDEAEGERDAEQVGPGDGGHGLAREHERGHDEAGPTRTRSAVPRISAAARCGRECSMTSPPEVSSVIRQCRMLFARTVPL